ncbi:MAG: DNA repair protein RecO [Sediminibacterium sp.]|nr:DNA repair protein RecO [Sediminibacterium sp.]
MVFATKGLVLHVIPFQETSIITKILTPELGLQSFIVKGARQSSNSKSKKHIYFQHGSLLQIEFNYNSLRNIQYLSNIQWHYIYQNLFNNVVKSAVLIYMVEVLNKVIFQPEPNPLFFEFLENFITDLDNQPSKYIGHIPIIFLLKLAHQLGISLPLNKELNNPHLHLNEMQYSYDFQDSQSIIPSHLANYLNMYLKPYNLNDQEFKQIVRKDRQELLQYLHHFYFLQGKPLNNLKSVPIIQEIL